MIGVGACGNRFAVSKLRWTALFRPRPRQRPRRGELRNDVRDLHHLTGHYLRFPLDLVWLQSDGRVAAVLINVPICSSPPCPLYEPAGTNQAIAVLELAARHSRGEARKLLLLAAKLSAPEIGRAHV